MNLRGIVSHLIVAITVASTAAFAQEADARSDEAAVRHVLMSQFDKPESRLQVDPVVVSGDAAVASWAQGDRGGRALLARHKDRWQITLCAGDALKDAKVMREAGVRPSDAKTLAEALVKAEARLTQAQRAKFSTFDGMVRMDGNGQHPPEHRH